MMPHVSAVFPATIRGRNRRSDAEIMLRGYTGDQSAFDYPVQKHWRAMVSYMYRMARNRKRRKLIWRR